MDLWRVACDRVHNPLVVLTLNARNLRVLEKNFGPTSVFRPSLIFSSVHGEIRAADFVAKSNEHPSFGGYQTAPISIYVLPP